MLIARIRSVTCTVAVRREAGVAHSQKCRTLLLCPASRVVVDQEGCYCEKRIVCWCTAGREGRLE